MGDQTLDISNLVRDAFSSFKSDTSLFALPLTSSNGSLSPAPTIGYPQLPDSSFQAALTQLEDVLNPKLCLYLILRRDVTLAIITYIPYLANKETRGLFLSSRTELVNHLGTENFASSFICKEMGEITDARSWDERDAHERTRSEEEGTVHLYKECDTAKSQHLNDVGYKKNKCRLCDRRMKNKIEDAALEALRKMNSGVDCVQLSVNITTETLQLNFYAAHLDPAQVTAKLPANRPSFTFYRHLHTRILYFIFCSPDVASVHERMKHTMAIPGLVNIIAQENGVSVSQNIEIHEPEVLEFAEKDERVGRFRSMYLRNGSRGTESTWSNMEADQKVLDAIE